jgi:hypothetical protein
MEYFIKPRFKIYSFATLFQLLFLLACRCAALPNYLYIHQYLAIICFSVHGTLFISPIYSPLSTIRDQLNQASSGQSLSGNERHKEHLHGTLSIGECVARSLSMRPKELLDRFLCTMNIFTCLGRS